MNWQKLAIVVSERVNLSWQMWWEKKERENEGDNDESRGLWDSKQKLLGFPKDFGQGITEQTTHWVAPLDFLKGYSSIIAIKSSNQAVLIFPPKGTVLNPQLLYTWVVRLKLSKTVEFKTSNFLLQEG